MLKRSPLSALGLVSAVFQLCTLVTPAHAQEALEKAPPANKEVMEDAKVEEQESVPAAKEESSEAKEKEVEAPVEEATVSETVEVSEEAAAVAEEPAAVSESGSTTSEDAPGDKGDDYSEVSTEALVEEEAPKKNLIFGVGLDLTLPMGSTADFSKSVSIQGFSLDLRYYAWGNWGIGAGIAFDTISEKTTDELNWKNLTFSSVQIREQSFMPITVKGVYAWRDEEKLVPYIAAGIGAARTVQRLHTGISSLSDAAWHFALVPELGTYLPVGPTVLFANIRFNYLPPSGGQTQQMYGNLSFGVTVQ